MPTPTPGGVPKPSASIRSSWSSDEFTFGADSFLAVGSSPDDRVALRQIVAGRLFFAGEATSSEHPGTVHGAQSSGTRAAIEAAAAAQPGERIAVVGAGIAGATAAKYLIDAGFEVLVFEGRDRIGGRIETVAKDDWPVTVELGASWVLDVDASKLEGQLTGAGIATAPVDSSSVLLRSFSATDVQPSDVGAHAVSSAVTWAAQQSADLSLSAALDGSGGGKVGTGRDDAGVSDADRLAGYLATDVADRFAADADELSAWYSFSEGTTGKDAMVLGPFDDLVKDSLADVDVSLSTPVREISYDEEAVRLKMATGESIRVDRVIVTVPLGVLKADAIRFDPVLPFAHRAAIAALGMGMQEKIWLRFDESFWTSEAVQWDLVPDASLTPSATAAAGDSTVAAGTAPAETPAPTDSAADAVALPFTRWINLQPLTGETVLVGVASGGAAAGLAKLSDAEVLELALASLEPFVPKSP